jgi:tRNA threonylcarbamoyladenosine biosynthesis protein TsaB
MNILAVDCSTELLGIGVGRGLGEEQGSLRFPKHPYRESEGHSHAKGPGFVSISIDTGYRHTERVMGAIEFCVAEAGLKADELDLLACMAGPGSFTGLRIGMATVKGLALGLGKPFVAVPTLDAIAAGWEGAAPIIVPVIDAKRSRFYFALYANGSLIAGPYDDGIEKIIAVTQAFPEVLFVGPDADLLETGLADRSGYRVAVEHRRSPVYAMARRALAIFVQSGASASDSGLMYLRESEAEETLAMGLRQ